MIGGFGYDYNRRFDTFATVQSNAIGTSSQARIRQAGSPCKGVGFVNSLRLNSTYGTSQQKVGRFCGLGGIGTPAVAGEWHRDIGPGTNLAINTGVPHATNSCYFTFLGGNFSSDNEYAYLLPVGDNWYFFIGAASNGGIRVSYRCIPHAQ